MRKEVWIKNGEELHLMGSLKSFDDEMAWFRERMAMIKAGWVLNN